MTGRASCALVTGAASGIGQAFAEHLARLGYDLILVGSRADRLERRAQQLIKDHKVQAQVLPADLEREDGIGAVAHRIESGPAIDILVNSAGSPAQRRLSHLDPDALGGSVRVNIMAMSRLCHSAMIRMLDHGSGGVINIAPAVFAMLLQERHDNGAFRSFTEAFTRHLQMEAEGTGVRVQLLIPGVVDTDIPAIEDADLRSLPPWAVITPAQLVGASVRSLALGEPICCPLFPTIHDWESYVHAASPTP
jgi:short-subunit dehydrogenase